MSLGGMASVLRVYRGSFPDDRYELRFIATSTNRVGRNRVWQMVSGAGATACSAVRSRHAIFHLHVASRWSFFRKAAVAIFARVFGHRVILHVHGASFTEFLRRNPILLRFARWLFRSADRVVALSPRRRDELVDLLPGCEWVVLSNPVDAGPQPKPMNDRQDRAVFLGAMDERKGMPDLLSAIRSLQEKGRRFEFVLAGTGDVAAVRAAVDQLPAPECVDVRPRLSPDEVKSLLDDSTVFCLPSYSEGVSIALLEAMSRGLVCVTTPVGGTLDAITDDENGLLVAPGDREGLARALERAFTPGLERERLSAAARATIERRFAADVVVERLVALYDDLRD